MPFFTIQGKGLKSLVECCIEIGAKYGKFDSADILLSHWTVQRHAIAKTKIVTDRYVDKLKVAMNKDGVVDITGDMWMDHKNRH